MKLLENKTEVIAEAPGKANAAVIWLHGLGADGYDFAGFVPELGLPEDHGVRFIFPHAPVRPVTINGGMPMRAWYDIPSLTRLDQQDSRGIRESEALVHRYIQQQIDGGIPASRIVIAGFSQGGAITLHTALRHPQRLAGAMALSTYLPLHEMLEVEAHAVNRDLPVFMCHGTHDPVLQYELGENSCKHLQQLGYAVEWHSYAMAHQVCMEEAEDIGAWLRKVLP